MKKNTLVALVVLGAAALLAKESLFIVDQTEQVLVHRLGEVVRQIQKPGLNAKIPFIEDVVRYDNRLLGVYFEPREVVVRGDEKGDTKRAIVDAYAKYRIERPLEFYRSVRTEAVLKDRLTPVFENSMRKEVGATTLGRLLSSGRHDIMTKTKDSMNRTAESFGIKVEDVRILRTDLPQNNSRAVYDRMIAQHEKEARQTRAEGEEQSQKIKSEADKTVRVLMAQARKESEITRGRGEGEASAIYAAAFSRDPEFYGFYRTMQAYRSSLAEGGEKAKIVMSPKNEFFRYMHGNMPEEEGGVR
jgi:membrane protease subunit HflC